MAAIIKKILTIVLKILISITVLILLCLFIARLTVYATYINQKSLSNRALIVLVENAETLTEEDKRFYKNNKNLIDPIMAMALGVKKQDFVDKDILEIVDYYGEPYLADNIFDYAKAYRKRLFLSDSQATLDYLYESIKTFNDQGLIVDLVINVHGNENVLVFWDRDVTKKELIGTLGEGDLSLGFVYQTACHGSSFLDAWGQIGAQAVNGAKGINSYPIFSPAYFMKAWVFGNSFEKAVDAGYKKEVFIWQLVSKIIPDANYWLTPEVKLESEMQIAGNKWMAVNSEGLLQSR